MAWVSRSLTGFASLGMTAREPLALALSFLCIGFWKEVLPDLRDDSDVSVGDLGNLVLDRGAEENRGFRAGQRVVLLEPGRQGGGRLAKRLVERAGEAHRHQVLVVLDPDPADALF